MALWQEKVTDKFFVCDFLFPVLVYGIEYKLADSFQHVSVSCNTYIIECVILFRIFTGLKTHAWGGAL